MKAAWFNRFTFWLTRHADYAVAMQACFPSVSIQFLGYGGAAASCALGLAMTSQLIAFGKRKKSAQLQVPDTSGTWLVAGGLYASLGLLAWRIPDSSQFALTASLLSSFFLLLYERHARRRYALKRIARRRMEHRQWQIERKQLEHQWNERLKWLAGVQHDMRQPLHAMDLLMVHPGMQTDPRFSQVVKQLRSCQRWLYELAENTMEVAKLQLNGELSSVKSSSQATVAHLLSEMTPWVGPMADIKGLGLRVSDADNPIMTDTKRLKRVLLNVLHNAIRHTDSGQVWIDYTREQGGIHCFRIGDTGPGLPRDVIAQIQATGPVQAERLPTRGLGLYVVRSFCQELGWHLDVDRSGPEGTVFSIRLPDSIGNGAGHSLRKLAS